MKKKILSGLLAFAMSVSLLAGVSQPVMAETTQATVAEEVAVGKTVTVSNERTKNPAIYAVDGDKTTVWSPGSDETATIEVDLEQNYTIDKVSISTADAIAEEINALNAAIEGLEEAEVIVEADIVNDKFWTDTDGNTIFSQGGGIFKFGDTYYWYGAKYQEAEWYAADPSVYYNNSDPSPMFLGVTCYTSKDLVNWDYKGLVVTRDEVSECEEMNGETVAWVGRLGVAYMEESGKYALFVQHEYDDPGNVIDGSNTVDDNWTKQVLVLTSDTPDGEFTWNNRINMVDYNGGTSNTGDQTVFTDDNGKDYLVYSYGVGRGTIYISEIIENDGVVTLDKAYKVYKGSGREGNCMFKYDGKYYICASDLYGWNASHAYYIVLDSLTPEYLATLDASPLKSMEVMDGCSDDFCHVTQTGFFYTVEGTEQNTVIFCGDRWAGFAGNGLGFNQWCPLTFNENGRPYYNSLSAWDLDVTTGVWTVADGNNYAKNGSFDADRVSSANLAGWTNTITEGDAPIGNVTDRVTGKYALKIGEGMDFEAKVSQIVSSTPYVALPDGIYDLKAKVKTNGSFDKLNMYAKCQNLTSQTAITETYASYTTIILEDVVVAGGSVEIGFDAKGSAGAYCYVDDVALVLSTGEAVEAGSITGKIVSDTAKELTITATSEDGMAYVCTVAGDAESFTISPVKAGTYTVEVTAHACEITNGSQEVTVAAGASASVEDIIIVNQSGNASGKVVDEAGEPLADVTVTLSQEDGEVITTTTVADGTYTFEDVKVGTYTISFERRGYAANEGNTSTVEIKLNETVAVADAAMTKVTGDVAGVLTDAEGNAVSGAVVTYYFKEDNSLKYTATTDENGAYRMEGLVEGSYMAVATRYTNPDDAWQEFNAGNNNVEIKLNEVADGNLQFAVDMTDKIVNPTFNTAKDLTGWTNGATTNGGYRTGKNTTHGTYSLAPWANSAFDMDTYQTINDLENGKYLVSCWASADYSEIEKLEFYAKDGDGNELARETIPVYASYRTVVLVAEVTDGTLTIGIDGHFEGGSWANIDDFHLGLLEVKETTVEDELEKLTKVELEAEALEKEDYTEESWAVLEAAVNNAKEVKNASVINKEDVAAARKAIEEAIKNLVAVKYPEPTPDPEPVVDKTSLNAAITDAETLKAEDYTAETWSAFQTALTAAKAETAKADATQETVDAAVKALADAKAALKAADKTPAPVVKETTITLSETKLSMGVNEKKVKLTATVEGAADQTVTWTSSKTSVVKVKNGVLTAGKKTGTATITATTADGKTASCKVTVKKAPAKITLNAKTKKLKVGKTFTVKVKKYKPAKAASYKLTFKSSNKKVASVDANGVVKAKKKGTAKITVKTYNGKKATITIKVNK
ncbi:MAG: carboxypeptidase regulatory-like domain-containing protein [Lachnospiraceae bacterium]|nr:carboxypeptidase regulatory-like domain-containing protein [Lachnospiraceae bacterium]